MIGQVLLGKYKVIRLLDRGGMSNVYLAHQLDQKRDVVVKVLQPQHLAQSKTRQHFQREIYIMSRFRHPGAVAYFDSSVKEKSGPILVMEYLRGVEVHELLRRDGKLSPERTGRLLASICDVLQAAHDAGIVHRDVKPGNLMVLNAGTPQESVRLMDFGLAKMSSLLYISPDDLVDFTLPAASGTPEYISPEMVRGQEVDARGDIYSVGVVLYEMLTGRRPFTHEELDDLLLAHAHDAPPTFAEVGFTEPLPSGLEAVVRSCLAKQPDDRPRTAMELAQRYEQALGRRINVLRRAPTASAPPPAPVSSKAPASLRANMSATASEGVRQSLEAIMPEALAMVKLRGFIFDLGGEVVESVPGMITVRVPDPQPQKSGGLFGWMSRGNTTTVTGTVIELHMERRDPSQPSKLTITLVMKPNGKPNSLEWQTRCKKIGMDLQAYLMGR